MNGKTPGAGRRTGAFESVIVGTSDASDLAHPTAKIQSEHLRQRFNLSPSVAATVAALAFNVPENWRGAR